MNVLNLYRKEEMWTKSPKLTIISSIYHFIIAIRTHHIKAFYKGPGPEVSAEEVPSTSIFLAEGVITSLLDH